MILCEQEFKLDFLEQIASKLSNKDIELVLVDEKEMRAINKEQRGIDKTTDVLSFPLFAQKNLPLGSIVINLDAVRTKANELKHSQEAELALLFIHGMLHLLGFDHEKDKGEMRAKEAELVEFFHLPKSLIIRTQDE